MFAGCGFRLRYRFAKSSANPLTKAITLNGSGTTVNAVSENLTLPPESFAAVTKDPLRLNAVSQPVELAVTLRDRVIAATPPLRQLNQSNQESSSERRDQRQLWTVQAGQTNHPM
jgi:hypothetical protein